MDSDVRVVVVARHGARRDYEVRDAESDGNWVSTAERPWDPPLSETGLLQGKALGEAVRQHLEKLSLPPIDQVYSSPLQRCRQTAACANEGLGFATDEKKVRVEFGLVESMNEAWYRSWALPTSDGTWNHKPKDSNGKAIREVDVANLRSEAVTKSAFDLVVDWKESNDPSLSSMDVDYESQSHLGSDDDASYKWGTFESNAEQRKRMRAVVETLSQQHSAVLLLSHGAPVTHLYEDLSGNPWHVHGVATYACFSIYVRRDEEEASRKWDPVVVNESRHAKLGEDRQAPAGAETFV